ncbi:ATP-binding protein [Nocardioides sp. cx-169]|uniref:ATP-binding protein n=1 Tax=Nocardioides sp. cx-169 TaxID=2899080 RepID=UPI001E4271F2|nr:ATP-binding protein [Nocardioides sp. cx-169]MCD4536368.1 ATP-binding protein [Nocardioides sp. cx-169]
MTLPAPHAAELARAMDALELLVATRLEERRGGTGPGGLLGRRPPQAGDEGLPDAAVFDGHGPLAEVVRAGGLGVAEAVIVTAVLAREVDDRFDALYALLSDRPGAAGLTGEVARTLVARSPAARLEAPMLLGAAAPLVSAGIVELAPARPALSGDLRATDDFLQWALGRPTLGGPDETFPARPLQTVHRLGDVVVPHPQAAALRGLVHRIRDRRTVVEEWGFGRHHDAVSGLVALFHGPSGTGKSMAAAAIGREAGLPVWQVELSHMVSKYVGETAKQLGRVFDRAAREGWMLLFDEADAVFGKRTEVSDAHDRYANQDVSYLLTRLADHPGTVVLTTNLLANIDEAFQRRLHVVVEFEEPGPAERGTLWSQVRPPALPIAGDIDWTDLARSYPLTGAQIRDATVDAAYDAAADGRVVTRDHLVDGIRAQFAKAGRTMPVSVG